MKRANEQDDLLPAKKAEKSPNFRKLMKKAFDQSDSSIPFPVNMDKFSARNFVSFMSSSRNRTGGLLTSDGYASKKSCIFHLYRLASTTQPEEVKQVLGQAMAGLKRQKNRIDQSERNRLKVGKESLNKDVYEFICSLLLKSSDVTSTFAHFFITLQWNLIGRSESVTNSHVMHLEWIDDCIVIYFAHTKCDQEGLKRDEPWHIYANPLNPTICPVLAMARYLLSNEEILKEKSKLFPGTKQYDRYSKYMKTFFAKNKELFLARDMDVSELGSHSARKGAATYCLSGCTVAPPFVAVCLRACWSLGVKDRYLRHDSAGDRYLGRALAMLPISQKEFAVSPPYFENNDSSLG